MLHGRDSIPAQPKLAEIQETSGRLGAAQPVAAQLQLGQLRQVLYAICLPQRTAASRLHCVA